MIGNGAAISFVPGFPDDGLDEYGVECGSVFTLGCFPRAELSTDFVSSWPIRPKSNAGEKPAISLLTSIVGVVMARLCCFPDDPATFEEEVDGSGFFLLGPEEGNTLFFPPLSR